MLKKKKLYILNNSSLSFLYQDEKFLIMRKVK